MLSVVIPSYRDPFLHKTIASLLENAGGEIEIVVVLDGYWPSEPIQDDPRIVQLHLGKNVGMREAINAGVRIARGEYLMRTDEHCAFGKAFDRIILETIEDNWIVVPRRYFLDPVKWEVMPDPPVDYEKLVIQDEKKFSGQRWKSRTRNRQHVQIDETMACQGSMWVMGRAWWDKVIGELQTDGFGPMYQDSHEMVFKTWKAGGKLMLNKNTWYAHKKRTFSRTHQEGTKENPANAESGWKYAIDTWRDYYETVTRPKWGI